MKNSRPYRSQICDSWTLQRSRILHAAFLTCLITSVSECQSLGRTNGYHVSRHGVAPSLSLVVWRLSVRPNGTEVGLRHD